jgi:PhnB protein
MHKGDAMIVEPYLFFEGRCEEALEYYKTAIGAQVESVMRYSESPDPTPPGMLPPGSENKVMHASFKLGETLVMASDGGCSGTAKIEGFSLALTVDKAEDVDRFFNALSQGGSVQMPVGETFFAHRFGMCQDKFGVQWMIILPKPM